MVNRRFIAILLLCLAAAAAGFFLLHQSETDKIRGRLKSLSELAGKDAAEGAIAAAANAKKAADLFADPCFLEIPASPHADLSGRFAHQDIRAYILRARSRFQNISLDFHDISISLPAEEIADASLTGHLRAAADSEPPIDVFHELRIQFQKTDGQWLIKKIEAVPVLEK